MYPYEYMDSLKKFYKDKFPDRCEFFSSLKDDCISEKKLFDIYSCLEYV